MMLVKSISTLLLCQTELRTLCTNAYCRCVRCPACQPLCGHLLLLNASGKKNAVTPSSFFALDSHQCCMRLWWQLHTNRVARPHLAIR